jgi:hypothetical protein
VSIAPLPACLPCLLCFCTALALWHSCLIWLSTSAQLWRLSILHWVSRRSLLPRTLCILTLNVYCMPPTCTS